MDCDGRMVKAIRTGVNVLDFRHWPITVCFNLKWNLIYLMQKSIQTRMATIVVQTEINSSLDKVWEIISDIDNEPRFWKGTKEVKTLSKEGGVIKREITIAFRDQKCLQEIQLKPKKEISAKFTKGILNGTKIITLTPNNEHIIMQTAWEIKLSGMMNMFTGVIKNHIKSGTEQAMQSIKREIEG
ncbi:SRPBCC family protein [Nitrosopumilus sp.]|nr:SRPBCC family protein [Nitrosopumilus sp.]